MVAGTRQAARRLSLRRASSSAPAIWCAATAGRCSCSSPCSRGAGALVGTDPDAILICGERQFYDDRRDIVSNPILIVEVLSDSTEAYDRGDKFPALPQPAEPASLSAVFAIPYAGGTLRPPAGRHLEPEQLPSPSQAIPLRVIDAELSLPEVYDKLELSR
ncbi:Uma2 family endonuclease [Thiohalocapsa sp. ML1]|uniref:Uma2 family endonuclease n=1 Tax=Thiohalocapsa sp. ML1 TaxID=1431688 RepID=UPI003529938C